MKLNTFSDDAVFHTVYFEQEYDIHGDRDFRVIDIGMNVGYTSIFYAMNPRVREIYGFEPFQPTFKRAAENLECCGEVGKKIKAFSIGLGSRNEMKTVKYNSKDSESMSAVIENDGSESEVIVIKDAAETLGPLLTCSGTERIVCKMDCEGAEYDIFESLERGNLLEKIDVFLIEWHFWDDDRITDCLKKHHFTYMKSYSHSDIGFIRAWKQG